MEAVSGPISTRPGMRPVDRVVAAFLFVLLAAGSLFLWTGMPALSLWAVAQLVESPSQHLTLGLLAVPAGMILFAPLLFWINALYLRVTGVERLAEDDEGGEMLRVRGPLEPLLVWSFLIGVVALVLWFAFFSTGPGPRSII